MFRFGVKSTQSVFFEFVQHLHISCFHQKFLVPDSTFVGAVKAGGKSLPTWRNINMCWQISGSGKNQVLILRVGAKNECTTKLLWRYLVSLILYSVGIIRDLCKFFGNRALWIRWQKLFLYKQTPPSQKQKA